jgi:predicted TIM-barrel fold metal-dependent hydrolase
MIIDVNVHVSRWPFRRLRGDEALGTHLRAKGVARAWAGSFDGVFHLDVAAANARLAEEARRDALLVPFGTVNPAQADWEEDLRRCHEVHAMPGIRLYPNYHDYALTDPRVEALLRAAAGRRLVVQLALKLEDVRTQHRLARVPTVDPAPLAGILKKVPDVRLVLLNALGDVKGPALQDLAAAGNVWFEISALEGAAGLAALPAERLLFGSHAPFLTWEAAYLKLQEAGLDAARRAALLEGNARRVLTF